MVCLLKKSLYGLRQAARIWYDCLHRVLLDYGLVRVSHDQAIWKKNKMAVSAHVDNIVLIGTRTSTTALKSHLSRAYKFKDLGPVNRYLGVFILRDRQNNRLVLDQAPYVQEILEGVGMMNCTPSSTPMDPRENWDQTEKDVALKGKEIKLYQRLIGQLMYLMLATRPDIAYAVTKLAQYASKPTQRHWNGILHVLKYLRSHDSVRLRLGKVTEPSPPINLPVSVPLEALVGFFDASLMDCQTTRRSTGAYLFFLSGALISWVLKKQGLVALSSTEAEFIAGTEAA